MEATHENGNSGRRFHVVALPLPGRGHINPMLSFCRRLAAREGLLVTVVVTEEWLRLLSSSSAAAAASPESNLRLRTIPDVIPSESTRGQDYADFIHAVLTKMGGPVEALVAALEPPADAVVADALLPWAAGIGRRRGVPVAALFPQAAAVFLALHEFKSFDDGRPLSEIHASGKANGYLDYIPRNSSPHLGDLFLKSSGQNMIRTSIQVLSWFGTAQSLLFNSFDELEGHALNTLRSKLSIPIHSVGPCIPPMTTLVDNPSDPYYKWLDSQQQSSVLYVSLGSFLPISDVHLFELATGLQMSGVPFLWVMRGDCKQIEKLSGETGFVVPWCDQLSVLCHPSVGGFLTHCGWNSTLEGIYAGVPMVTYPLMWDQYPNSKLIVDDWKVGFRIKNEEEGVVGREQIANVVQKLMDLDADDSRELRRRAREFKERSLKALNEKGSSTTSIDAFLQDVNIASKSSLIKIRPPELE